MMECAGYLWDFARTPVVVRVLWPLRLLLFLLLQSAVIITDLLQSAQEQKRHSQASYHMHNRCQSYGLIGMRF
jgi:hypothetical protein